MVSGARAFLRGCLRVYGRAWGEDIDDALIFKRRHKR